MCNISHEEPPGWAQSLSRGIKLMEKVMIVGSYLCATYQLYYTKLIMMGAPLPFRSLLEALIINKGVG
jgi:hypothetical protein